MQFSELDPLRLQYVGWLVFLFSSCCLYMGRVSRIAVNLPPSLSLQPSFINDRSWQPVINEVRVKRSSLVR